MSEMNIEIDEGRTAFAPGEQVTGRVSWQLTEAPRGLSLRLFCHTAGRGTNLWMSTPTTLLMVLIRETPSAPPRWAARP